MKESNQERARSILKSYRKEIDALDVEIMKLMGKRFGVIRKVAKIKVKQELPSFLHDRVVEVRENGVKLAKKYGIDPHFAYALYSAIIYQSCAMEDEIKKELKQKAKKK